MLSPEKFENMGIRGKIYNSDDIASLIDVIDKEMVNTHGMHPWEDALCTFQGIEEIPMKVRDDIAKMYLKNGWGTVCHMSSLENGERPGLTHFMFFRKDQDPYKLYKNLADTHFHVLDSTCLITHEECDSISFGNFFNAKCRFIDEVHMVAGDDKFYDETPSSLTFFELIKHMKENGWVVVGKDIYNADCIESLKKISETSRIYVFQEVSAVTGCPIVNNGHGFFYPFNTTDGIEERISTELGHEYRIYGYYKVERS